MRCLIMSDFYRRHNPNILNKNYLNKNNFYSNINSNVNREYLAKDLTEDLEIKAKAEAFDKLFDLLKDKVRRRPHYNNLEAFLAKDSDYETYYFKSFTSEEVLNILKVMKEVNPNFKYNLDGN